MGPIEFYIIIIVALSIFSIGSILYARGKPVENEEDIVFSRMALAEEIIGKQKGKVSTNEFEGRLEKCRRLFYTKRFQEAEDCIDSMLNDLRNIEVPKKQEREFEDVTITCKKCGTKLSKKYEICPICGEKL